MAQSDSNSSTATPKHHLEAVWQLQAFHTNKQQQQQ